MNLDDIMGKFFMAGRDTVLAGQYQFNEMYDSECISVIRRGDKKRFTFYRVDYAIQKFTNEEWFFIASEQQINWMKSIKDEVCGVHKETINNVLSRKIPYYTLKEREDLNEIKEIVSLGTVYGK